MRFIEHCGAASLVTNFGAYSGCSAVKANASIKIAAFGGDSFVTQ